MRVDFKLVDKRRILLSTGTFLLGCIFFSILVSTVLFALQFPIHSINIGIAIVLSAIMCHLFMGRSAKYTFAAVVIGILILFLSVIVSSGFYDCSWDGNTYHKSITGALRYGWNPLYENLYDFAAVHLEFLSQRTQTWYDAYPKGTEIWGACIYAVVNQIEGGKSFNLVSTIAVFCIISALLDTTSQFKKWQICICSLFCALNPVILSQLMTFYNDGFLWQMLLLCGGALLYLTFYEQGHLQRVCYYLIFITIGIGFNIKFSAIIFFAAECLFFFFVWVIQRLKIKKDKQTFRFIAERFFLLACAVFNATAVVGATSYVTNTFRYHNPFYTMIGEGATDIVALQTPKAYQKMTHFMRFIASLFSRTSNNKELTDIEWKIPFLFDNGEFSASQNCDVRIAGWGILFGGIFLISLIVIGIEIYRSRRKPHSPVYILSLGGALILLLLIILVPGLYWARYNGALFFIPIGVLLHLFVESNREPIKSVKGTFIAGVLTVLLFVNVIPNIVELKHEVRQSISINTQLEDFERLTRYNQITVGCEDKWKFEGRFFNLFDKGINNFRYGEVKSSDCTGTLFPIRKLQYRIISGPASLSEAEEYLDYISEMENCMILMAVKDEGSQSLTESLIQRMRTLGLKFNLPNHYRYGYIAVIDDGEVLYEALGDEKLEYTAELDQCTISMMSAGYLQGNAASIIVNDIDYSLNQRGLNIVLLDKNTGELIDRIAIDSYMDNILSRK